MRLNGPSISRPLLWLCCAFAISLVCFWGPIWFDVAVIPNSDARLTWAMTMLFSPALMSGGILSLTSYLFLWRAVRRCGSGNLTALILGSLMFMATLPPCLFAAPGILLFFGSLRRFH